MIARRILILIQAAVLLFSFCACGVQEGSEVKPTAEVKPTTTTTEMYSTQLEKHLGVKPKASSFDEIKRMAQAMQGSGYYREDEEHHCCSLVYNGNGYENIPEVSDADINAFKSFFD